MALNTGKNRKTPVIILVRIAITAALYFVLTAFVEGISFGPLQFRVAEGMTLLPLLFPETVFGLTLGCLLANIFSPYGWYDVLFGTLATLIAAGGTWAIGRFWKTNKLWLKCILGAIPPIIANGFGLPAMWLLMGTEEVYWLNVGILCATEAGTVLPIGTLLVMGLSKIKIKNLKNS